jgi:hypothetical protein
MTDPRHNPKQAKKPVHNEAPDRADSHKPLRAEIRSRIAEPHKGDVGRPETNEEIFQGSKIKELR